MSKLLPFSSPFGLLVSLFFMILPQFKMSAQDNPGKLYEITISKDHYLKDALKEAAGNQPVSAITNLKIYGTMYTSDIGDLREMLLYGPENGGPGLMKRIDLSDVTYINGNFDPLAFGQCVVDEFILPNSITLLDGNTFFQSRIKHLTIGEKVTSVNTGNFEKGKKYWSAFGQMKGLESIKVASGNKYYKVVDNSLVTIDGKRLELYPNGLKNKSYKIPASVEEIGPCAFSGVESLETVDLNNVKVIGSFAFSNQISIKNFIFGHNLKIIGEEAFFRETSKEVIDDHSDREWIFPEGLEYVGYNAFYPTLGYKSLTFPSTIKEFGQNAVAGDGEYNSHLITLDLSKCSQLKEIPEQFSYYNSNLTNLRLPENGVLKKIGHSAFFSCSNLREINIPNSVEELDENAFMMYDEIIPTKTSKIHIGSGIKILGGSSLGKMINLKEVQIDAVDVPKCVDQPFASSSVGNAILYVPQESIESYKSSNDFSGFKEIKGISLDEPYNGSFELSRDGKTLIKWTGNEQEIDMTKNSRLSKVEKIGEAVFYENGTLQNMILSSSVKEIEWIAFAGSNIEHIKLSDNLQKIDKQAFSRCMGLEEINFPSSLNFIGEKAFFRCNHLKSIALTQQIDSIADMAFSSCMNLKSVDFGLSHTKLGNAIFYLCDKLDTFKVDPNSTFFELLDGVLFSKDHTVLYCFPPRLTSEYTVPDGTKIIGGGAFSGVTGLKSITLPQSLTRIENYAFYFCRSIESISLSRNVNYIGKYAFSATLSLKSITVDKDNVKYKDIKGVLYSKDGTVLLAYPFQFGESYNVEDGCLEIADGTFLSCTGLRAVTLPATLQKIGNRAFERCSIMMELNLPASLKEIGKAAFLNCSKLTKLFIPEGIERIEEDAISFCSEMKELLLPSTLKSIASNALFSDGNLTKVYCKSANAPSAKDIDFKIFVPSKGIVNVGGRTLYVPIGSKESYLNAEGWRTFENIEEIGAFPDSNTSIEHCSIKVYCTDDSIEIETDDNNNHKILIYDMEGAILVNKTIKNRLHIAKNQLNKDVVIVKIDREVYKISL